jgi:hypothetical protein
MLASIGVYLAVGRVCLDEHQDQPGRLDDFVGECYQMRAGQSHRQALRGGTVLPHTRCALPEQLGGLRLHRSLFGFKVRQDVYEVLREDAGVVPWHGEVSNVRKQAVDFAWRRSLHPPDAGKVRLAVRCSRRWSGKVGLSVPRPGSPWIRVVQPLALGEHTGGEHDPDGKTHEFILNYKYPKNRRIA